MVKHQAFPTSGKAFTKFNKILYARLQELFPKIPFSNVKYKWKEIVYKFQQCMLRLPMNVTLGSQTFPEQAFDHLKSTVVTQ